MTKKSGVLSKFESAPLLCVKCRAISSEIIYSLLRIYYVFALST